MSSHLFFWSRRFVRGDVAFQFSVYQTYDFHLLPRAGKVALRGLRQGETMLGLHWLMFTAIVIRTPLQTQGGAA